MTTPVPPAPAARFGVRSIRVGECQVPGPELFWMSGWGEWQTLVPQVVLVEGPGVVALVNTGPPADLSALNARWTAALGERAALRRRPEEMVERALAERGVGVDDVTHVLLTPLQLYTTANVPLFGRAQICISRRGWLHFHSTHEHPHDDRWTSISREVLVHLVTDAWDRVRLLDDEDEVVPGIRTWWSGAHHRASMCIDVDTADGVVAISDSFFVYANVEDGRMLGICESMEEAITAYARVRRTARHIVPLYDPAVFERHPGGVVVPCG